MIKLTMEKLIEHLHQINTDPKTRERYNSKVNHMMNFLRKTSGFKIAAVKKGGSGGKQTDIRTSDVDIIYTTSKDKDPNIMKKELFEKIKNNKPKGTHLHVGKKAVHVDYENPRCYIDLVYKIYKQFKQEAKKINQIKRLSPMHKNAIKLAKYAIYKAKVSSVHGYEVELACIQLKDVNLVDCVIH
ncbi:MAG: hypothetical protein ACFFBH_05870 [Promethearchaeota archaeon]